MLTRKSERITDPGNNIIKPFTNHEPEIYCPGFYLMHLVRGCPGDCAYCYVPAVYTRWGGIRFPEVLGCDWTRYQKKIEKQPAGSVFNCGDVGDSLAIVHPNLENALDYFGSQTERYLLLVSKFDNILVLQHRGRPSANIIVSFSINSMEAWEQFEKKTPDPMQRLATAEELIGLGWRVRIRIDPMIARLRPDGYRQIAREVRRIQPEVVTLGTLRGNTFRNHNFPEVLKRDLTFQNKKFMYPPDYRVGMYRLVADELGYQPGLCKETREVWRRLGWTPGACNCYPGTDPNNGRVRAGRTRTGRTRRT